MSLNYSLTNDYQDAVGANFDVEKATKKFQFCLSESNDSELNYSEAILLMAEDQNTYQEWIKMLRKAIDCYHDLSNLYNVNKTLSLTHDPKAAVAFVHDHATRRIVSMKEKERHKEEKRKYVIVVLLSIVSE